MRLSRLSALACHQPHRVMVAAIHQAARPSVVDSRLNPLVQRSRALPIRWARLLVIVQPRRRTAQLPLTILQARPLGPEAAAARSHLPVPATVLPAQATAPPAPATAQRVRAIVQRARTTLRHPPTFRHRIKREVQSTRQPLLSTRQNRLPTVPPVLPTTGEAEPHLALLPEVPATRRRVLSTAQRAHSRTERPLAPTVLAQLLLSTHLRALNTLLRHPKTTRRSPGPTIACTFQRVARQQQRVLLVEITQCNNGPHDSCLFFRNCNTSTSSVFAAYQGVLKIWT